MNQPPATKNVQDTPSDPPQWRRPRGVARGTWAYVNEPSIAEKYDEFLRCTPLCEVDLEILRATFPVVETPQTILDLGCGSGRATIELVGRGYHVIAIDLSDSMLNLLSQKLSAVELDKHVGLLKANLVELGCLGDQVADHAICLFSTLGMIQGAENRKRFLQHVSRIVRPNGRLILHAHHRWAALREHRGLRLLLNSWYRSRRDPDHEFGDSMYGYRGLEKMFSIDFPEANCSDWCVNAAGRSNK